MKIIIRNETPQDYRVVEEMARDAFWNLYFPGCHEHFIIHKIRNHPDFIKELSFVIEVNGQVVGAIFYTHSKIIAKDSTEFKTISFGPVFISPKFHRQGLGKKLITHSISVAKAMGYPVITTLGYPYHYEPYGFMGGKRYRISMEDGKFYRGLLVLPLYEGALQDVSGYAVFSQTLECKDDEVETFERNFPPKKKAIQDSQKEYEIACFMLDE